MRTVPTRTIWGLAADVGSAGQQIISRLPSTRQGRVGVVLYAMKAPLHAQTTEVRKILDPKRALRGPTKKAREEALQYIGADAWR